MQAILIKILWAMGAKILTEAVFSKLVIYSLHKISQNTTNNLDDKIVGAVAEALNISDYK